MATIRAMKTKDAIKHFGSGTRLARELGCAHTAVYQWGDYPPIGRQYQIEVLTEGALRAERPDTERTGA